jgi:hypothetical protein
VFKFLLYLVDPLIGPFFLFVDSEFNLVLLNLIEVLHLRELIFAPHLHLLNLSRKLLFLVFEVLLQSGSDCVDRLLGLFSLLRSLRFE